MTPSQSPPTRLLVDPAPKPPTSVGQIFALIAGFLALAAIGAVLGWVLTNPSAAPGGADGVPSSPAIVIASSSIPSASASPSPSASPTPSGPLVPDFVTMGTDFITARTQLMGQGVSVRLFFDDDGQPGDELVTQTDPAAGQPMPRGFTVKMYVGGPAPQLNVPAVVGVQCSSAGQEVAATGFLVAYGPGGKSTSKKSVVLSQDPDATDTDAHWTDTVTLTCGIPQPSPSADPSPSLSAPPQA